MKHLYFCRHGLSELNKAGKWAGRTETPLSTEGIEGARQAGLHAVNLDISYILASPLMRAYDTAVIIANAIGYPVDAIEQNSLAVERSFGKLEGTPWQPDFDWSGVDDAESEANLIARANQLYEHLQTIDTDTVLVVSHGSLGRALRHIVTPATPFKSHSFVNSQIVKFK